MAFKPSSAPHSTGASGTSSLHSVGDPDYDHFLEKTKLSHSSNEVLTTRSPGGLHISPTPTPPTSARRDRGNPISTSSSKSKGQASTSATSTPSRDSEVLKYSEFLPKLVQERQRLETELKLLATQHRAIKKRRRTLQRLTKERVLKIQPPPPQQAPARPSAWAEHSSPKSGTKRQVKIMAPREPHGVFAMLGLSTASLGTKDRDRERERERANTAISSSSTVRKDRRSNTTTNAVHVNTSEMMNATASTTTTTAHQQTSFSASATPTKAAGSMAGGFARNMVAGQFASSPGGLNRASGPLATKAGHGHLQGSPRQALTNSSAVATSGPAEEDDGEGRRFFGTSKYRKYEMDVMKDDGFADLFSKFQASGIGHGEDDDEESEDKRTAAADAGVAAAAQSDAAEGGAGEDLKATTAAAAATTVDSGADSGEKAAVEVSTTAKASKEEESGGGGSSGDSDRERKVAVAVGVEVGSGEEETEADEPAKRAAKRASKRASSLLGSFIEMKRDYQKMLNEFEEKQKDNSIDANDKIAELQAILKQLRREQAALRARVQTSQDDAQLLESFSVGVSLFDKKKEDEASSKFGETRNRRKSRENAAAVDKKEKEKESEDEADDDNDEKKQKKKKKKKKEKANEGDGGGDEVDAAVRAKQANALAEYGADSAAFATAVRSSAVAEYGAAASTATSESSLGFTVVAAACGGSSATAEYGAAAGATSTAEYGGSAVAEYGAAAGGDDGDSNNGDEWDENKKKGKDKRRKRVGSRNKSSSSSNKSSGGGEGAGKEDANNEEDSNGASTSSSSSSTTASTEAAKARKKKKKRMAKRASVREILLKAYHEIAYEELQFDPKPLGNGAFGVVYKALWRGTPVAVKKLMVMQFTDAEVYNFKREASIMEKYSNHPCIVKFCGISSQFPHYCIVTEYMERGCVRDALADNPDLPWKTIVGMAVDAAAGILHLHAEHIIHRDLALRNMLVGRDWRVRMADFGLARMMPKDTYAKTRGNIGAVRWLAPEVISKSVYSEKSDSYAFGIVMWELLTRGEEPFADMTNVMEVALGIINEGLRPTVPRETPAEYAQLMSDCWARNADDRPDFVQIHRRLKAYHATLPEP